MSASLRGRRSQRCTSSTKRPRATTAIADCTDEADSQLIPLGKNSLQGERHLLHIGQDPRRLSRPPKRSRTLRPLTGIIDVPPGIVSPPGATPQSVRTNIPQESLVSSRGTVGESDSTLDAQLPCSSSKLAHEVHGLPQICAAKERDGEHSATSSSSTTSQLRLLLSQNRDENSNVVGDALLDASASILAKSSCPDASDQSSHRPSDTRRISRNPETQSSRRSGRQVKPSLKVREMMSLKEQRKQPSAGFSEKPAASPQRKRQIYQSSSTPVKARHVKETTTKQVGAARGEVAQSSSCGSIMIDVKPLAKRQKPMRTDSELALEEIYRSRMSCDELSIVRAAFCKYYPSPPSNMEAQGRYEFTHGKSMSLGLEQSLWERELKPWSNRWWTLYQMFNDEVRDHKMKKSLHKSTAVSMSECNRWAKAFYETHGDARRHAGAPCHISEEKTGTTCLPTSPTCRIDPYDGSSKQEEKHCVGEESAQ